MTRTTIAALPTVEATDEASVHISANAADDPPHRGHPRLTHPNNVPENAVSEREIACYGDSYVDYARSAYTRDNNAGRTKVGVVVYFVQDGEHLTTSVIYDLDYGLIRGLWM